MGVSILSTNHFTRILNVNSNIGLSNTIELESDFTSLKLSDKIGIKTQTYVVPNSPLHPVELFAKFGIGNNTDVVIKYTDVNASIGIGNSIILYKENILNNIVNVGIGSNINILNSTAINGLFAGVGIGNDVTILKSSDAQINNIIGFKTIINIQKNTQLTLFPIIGVSGSITIDNNSLDTDCELPNFNSLRWC